jgi:hypothetical protein
MRTNSRCCSKELLLLVVPKTALKEHPQVAQPEAQEKKILDELVQTYNIN